MTVDLSNPAAVRAEAERRLRAREAGRPLSGPAPIVLEPEDQRRREKETQADVVKLFRALGCMVYSTSQSRAAKVTPGIPDLWVVSRRLGRAWWWETKRPVGGRLSEAQVTFADECHATGTPYGSGSRADAEAYVIAIGLAGRGPDGMIEPTRTEGVTDAAA